MAFGKGTFDAIGGAVGDLLKGQAEGKGLRIKAEGLDLEAEGHRAEGRNYRLAADLAGQNEQFTKTSTEVKQMQADRDIAKGLGGIQAEGAASGFKTSGSVLSVMASGAEQGAVQKSLLGEQGLITEAGYHEQQKSYNNMAEFSDYAAMKETEMAWQTRGMADDAERDSFINAGFKALTAVATVFV